MESLIQLMTPKTAAAGSVGSASEPPNIKPTLRPLVVSVLLLSLVVVGCFYTAWQLSQRGSYVPQTHVAPLPPFPAAFPSHFFSVSANRVDAPRYVRNASALPPPPAGWPKIAVVLDDMGVAAGLTQQALSLPPAITFAFLPYGEQSLPLAQQARRLGHEVMIHLPMEPMPRAEEPPINPGPNALYAADTLEQIQHKTHLNMQHFLPLAVGVNNHMGSRFTAQASGMHAVLKILDGEGLFFLDSITTPESAVSVAATGLNLPLLRRDIFLDHYIETVEIEKALLKLEEEAFRQGQAIAIGHPHPVTLEALQKWAQTLEQKQLALVPISQMIREGE